MEACVFLVGLADPIKDAGCTWTYYKHLQASEPLLSRTSAFTCLRAVALDFSFTLVPTNASFKTLTAHISKY